MDQQVSPLPPSQIDTNIVKLAKTVESVYGNPWDIIWRNFLAGFMRVAGMAFAYVILLAVIFFVITQSGALTYTQKLWKNIMQGMIVDIQNNLQNSIPKIPSPNQNQRQP